MFGTKGASGSSESGQSERMGLMKGGSGGSSKKSGYSRLDGDSEGLLEFNETGGDEWGNWSQPPPESRDYTYQR